MSARKLRWITRDPAAPEALQALSDHHPLVAQLLAQRGFSTPDAMQAFLTPDYRTGLHNPFLLKGMETAARRIVAAITQGESLAVYGDFDCDGVTAVTLLHQALTAMGGKVIAVIPHRLREGYGLNKSLIEQLAAEGVTLLVTVDCGISNRDEVAFAQSLGVEVIVTDHHTPPPELPNAYAIVNPKQPGCEYPFKQLVGVGIAYKLVQALSRLGLKMPLRGRELLDVVALGTVADMGPLLDENRVLVKVGLESINTTERPGLQALIAVAGLAPGKMTSEDIAFMLAPRLNAAGRLDDAILSYKLLLADNLTTAKQLAQKLHQANRERQELTRDIQAMARKRAEETGQSSNAIVVLEHSEFAAGVVGLVAAKLVEEWHRPVLLIERGEHESRGSARSIPGFNILQALESCRDLFVRFGGHSAAAGFTLATTQIAELDQRLNAYAAQYLSADLLRATLQIDAETALADLTWDLWSDLSQLEPFGMNNARPVLMSRHVRAQSARAMGADGQHLKLWIDDGNGGPTFEAVAFRLGHMVEHFKRPLKIDIAYTLGVHEWNGARSLQLQLKDFRSSR
jgi:single-stranded-DNA-specific exonuclease